MESKRLMSRKKAAERLGCHRRTLENWERQGTGPAVIRLPNGLPYYTPEDIDAFIERYRVDPAAAGS